MSILELREKIGKEVTGNSSFDASPASYSAATVDQQIEITNRMKAFIRENPSQFNAAQNSIAAKPDIPPIENYTMSQAIGDFTDEFGNQIEEATKDVASIGTGVLNLASFGKWLIPAVGVAIVGIVVWKIYKSPSILPSLK